MGRPRHEFPECVRRGGKLLFGNECENPAFVVSPLPLPEEHFMAPTGPSSPTTSGVGERITPKGSHPPEKSTVKQMGSQPFPHVHWTTYKCCLVFTLSSRLIPTRPTGYCNKMRNIYKKGNPVSKIRIHIRSGNGERSRKERSRLRRRRAGGGGRLLIDPRHSQSWGECWGWGANPTLGKTLTAEGESSQY